MTETVKRPVDNRLALETDEEFADANSDDSVYSESERAFLAHFPNRNENRVLAVALVRLAKKG